MVFESAFINRPGFDPHSLLGAPLLLTPTRGDYLGEHTAKAFDEILPGRVLEENAILEAEKSEGTYDPDYLPQQEARDMFGTFPDTPKVRHSHAMSEEDWKASPFYRKEIEYRPDMTRTRARIMAENFDERRYRDALIANGDEVYGPVMKALSFGATLLGSLPDPVNVLPLGGGMRAASLAGKTGLKAAVKAGAKAGVVEGAAGAALSDAIVFPTFVRAVKTWAFLTFCWTRHSARLWVAGLARWAAAYTVIWATVELRRKTVWRGGLACGMRNCYAKPTSGKKLVWPWKRNMEAWIMIFSIPAGTSLRKTLMTSFCLGRERKADRAGR